MRLQRFKPNWVINVITVPTHNKHTQNKHISQICLCENVLILRRGVFLKIKPFSQNKHIYQNKHTVFALTKMCLFLEGEDFEKISTFSQNKHISKNKHTFLAARKCAYYEWAQYRSVLVNKHNES